MMQQRRILNKGKIKKTEPRAHKNHPVEELKIRPFVEKQKKLRESRSGHLRCKALPIHNAADVITSKGMIVPRLEGTR